MYSPDEGEDEGEGEWEGAWEEEEGEMDRPVMIIGISGVVVDPDGMVRVVGERIVLFPVGKKL